MHYPKVWLPKHEVPGFRGQLQPQGGREHIPIQNNIIAGREGAHTYSKQYYTGREGAHTYTKQYYTGREGAHTYTKQSYSRVQGGMAHPHVLVSI